MNFTLPPHTLRLLFYVTHKIFSGRQAAKLKVNCLVVIVQIMFNVVATNVAD